MRFQRCGTALFTALILATAATAADESPVAGGDLYWDIGQVLPAELLDLPDSGPRLPDANEVASSPAFSRALDAYRRHDLKVAERGFRATLAQTGEGPIADSARAYLAETILLGDATPTKRLQAIELYRTVAMQSPGSPNG